MNYCCVCEAHSGVFNRNIVGVCREVSKPVCQEHADGCVQDGHGFDAFVLPERLKNHNLEQVESDYHYGAVDREDMEAYLLAWNAVPGRFTRAYFQDGRIRQVDRS